MYICVNCQKKMKPDKRKVGADFSNGQVYPGDRYVCTNCSFAILVTTLNSIYDPEYETQNEYLEIFNGTS